MREQQDNAALPQSLRSAEEPKQGEAREAGAKKNPYKKTVVLDVFLLILAPVPLGAVFTGLLMVVSAVVSAISHVDLMEDPAWILVAGIISVVVFFVLFFFKFFKDVGKRNSFTFSENGAAPEDVQAELTRRALAEREAALARDPETPASAFDAFTAQYYGGDMDLAMKELIARAVNKDYSLTGGTKEGLKCLTATMTEIQKEKYRKYALNRILSDKAIVHSIVKDAAALTRIGMTEEEVRAAEANPFRKRVLLGAAMLAGALALAAAGFMLKTRVPQADVFGTVLAGAGASLGSAASYEFAMGLIRFFRFRKLKKRFADKDAAAPWNG